MRYASVAVAVALVLGGCLGASVGGDTPAGTTAPACEETSVETVDPVREGVTPSQLPERPSTLNATSAESFARAYERAYKRNTGLEAGTTQYEASVLEAATRDVDGGYVVNLTAIFWYNVAEPREGTTTPTVVHADGPRYQVVYFVGEDRVRRASALDDGELAPRRGAIVECWG